MRDNNATWTYDLEEELMLSERIDEYDLKDYKNVMYNRLQSFRDEWTELKHISIQAESEIENTVHLIKNEVIDMADKFDEMQKMILRQNEMIEMLVKFNLRDVKEAKDSKRNSIPKLYNELSKEETKQSRRHS